MQVIVNSYSGFCPGVKQAEKRIFEACQKEKTPLYIYGKLIHNKNYIQFLAQKGIQTTEEAQHIPPGSLLVIRTHGIDQKEEKKLAKTNKILDLTCFTVKKLQKTIENYALQDYFVVITGKKNHPEVIGLQSYAKDYYVIENKNEILEALEKIKARMQEKNYSCILVVSQTTGEEDLFLETAKNIEQYFQNIFRIEILNSICPVTAMREKEALAIQKEVDACFVIGDPLSSNAQKLYQILKNQSDRVYFVEDLQDLKKQNIPLHTYQKVQVISSSSTPDFIEKEVVAYLETI